MALRSLCLVSNQVNCVNSMFYDIGAALWCYSNSHICKGEDLMPRLMAKLVSTLPSQPCKTNRALSKACQKMNLLSSQSPCFHLTGDKNKPMTNPNHYSSHKGNSMGLFCFLKKAL